MPRHEIPELIASYCKEAIPAFKAVRSTWLENGFLEKSRGRFRQGSRLIHTMRHHTGTNS